MEIYFFNRSLKNGNYSIENVFSSIQDKLIEIYKIKNLTVPKNINYLQSINWARLSFSPTSINHITGDVNYLSLILPSNRTIITVHDIGHYTDTLKYFKKYFYYLFWLKLPFSIVKKITTVSEFSKNQIIKYCGIPENKIEVIYNPLPVRFSYRRRPSNIKFTILQIGSGRNKNLENLIKAVIGLDVRLLLINKLFDKSLVELLSTNKIDYIQYENLSDEEVVEQYSNSDILFFASKYEGFGMPIIESQAIGRPVITSNLASMPEIAGDAAIFVNPYSIIEIRLAILKLMNDQLLYDNLVQMGLTNIKRFEINNIFKKYCTLYDSFKII